jgi:hypothetical protein
VRADACRCIAGSIAAQAGGKELRGWLRSSRHNPGLAGSGQGGKAAMLRTQATRHARKRQLLASLHLERRMRVEELDVHDPPLVSGNADRTYMPRRFRRPLCTDRKKHFIHPAAPRGATKPFCPHRKGRRPHTSQGWDLIYDLYGMQGTLTEQSSLSLAP